MGSKQKRNQPGKIKPTLAMLNEELTTAAARKRLEIQQQLGFDGEATVYRIINGTRPVKPHEQETIARIYGKKPHQIDWSVKIKETKE